tara:strand:+ start:41 stop:592 length:552 start_codon:yes stop_codon:yes gene_type:complete
MPFHSNSAKGTVQYSTGTFYDQSKLVANDTSDAGGTTLATVSDLSIPLGGYERITGEYKIWYDSDDTNKFKFRIANLAQSDGSTAVATTIYTRFEAGVEESTSADTPAAVNLEGTGTSSTDGAGEIITIDIGAATTGTLITIYFNVISDAATKGNLVFQFANAAGSAAGTHLLAGSNVTYKKF